MTRASHAELRTGTVLVVDDTPATLEMCARMLRIDGHAVYLADSGTAAPLVLETLSPDHIIPDCMMPKMSGLELLQRLRGMQRKRRANDTTQGVA